MQRSKSVAHGHNMLLICIGKFSKFQGFSEVFSPDIFILKSKDVLGDLTLGRLIET